MIALICCLMVLHNEQQTLVVEFGKTPVRQVTAQLPQYSVASGFGSFPPALEALPAPRGRMLALLLLQLPLVWRQLSAGWWLT